MAIGGNRNLNYQLTWNPWEFLLLNLLHGNYNCLITKHCNSNYYQLWFSW